MSTAVCRRCPPRPVRAVPSGDQASGVRHHVGDRALEQARVGLHERERLGDVERDAGADRWRGRRPRRRERPSTAVGRTESGQGARLQAAHVEEVGDEGGQAVALGVDRLAEAPRRPLGAKRTSSDSRLEAAALMAASGVRRSWETAARSGGVGSVGPGQARLRRPLRARDGSAPERGGADRRRRSRAGASWRSSVWAGEHAGPCPGRARPRRRHLRAGPGTARRRTQRDAIRRRRGRGSPPLEVERAAKLCHELREAWHPLERPHAGQPGERFDLGTGPGHLEPRRAESSTRTLIMPAAMKKATRATTSRRPAGSRSRVSGSAKK